MNAKLRISFWGLMLLVLGACQGQFNFQWGTQRGPTGLLNLCNYFSGISECNSGQPKILNMTPSLTSGFEDEIHPALLSSCKDCHQVGKLKGDAPFAESNKGPAFTAALTRFNIIEEKVKGNHQYNSWSNDLKANKDQFVAVIQDYIQDLCDESGKAITYCNIVKELKTDSASISGPLTANFQYVRFPMTSLVYPSGLPAGKFPVYVEVGIRDESGVVAFGNVRVFSPNDDLTLGEISIQHNAPEGAQILRKFPQSNIGVSKATTTTPPPIPNLLPGATLTSLLSAPIASASVLPASPLNIALKFSSIRLGLPNTTPLTARQRFDQGVVPILQRSCMGCHNVTRGTYTMFPANDATGDARYMQSKNKIVAKNYNNSQLIQKGTGATNHVGGNAFNFGVNTADKVIVEAWINAE